VPYKTQPTNVNNLFCFFFQRNQECDRQFLSTKDVSNVPPNFKETIRFFAIYFSNFRKVFWAVPTGSLISVMLQVLQNTWCIAVNSLFNKCTQKTPGRKACW
jgi:hypothetical protein